MKYMIALGALMGVLFIAGCNSNKSQEVVAGESAPSTAVVKMIQDKINSDPALKGASITVTVENNMLTLKGTVSSVQQSEQAMMDASQVQTDNKLPIGAYNKLTIQGK